MGCCEQFRRRLEYDRIDDDEGCSLRGACRWVVGLILVVVVLGALGFGLYVMNDEAGNHFSLDDVPVNTTLVINASNPDHDLALVKHRSSGSYQFGVLSESNFRGPQGLQGPQGIQGARGPSGISMLVRQTTQDAVNLTWFNNQTGTPVMEYSLGLHETQNALELRDSNNEVRLLIDPVGNAIGHGVDASFHDNPLVQRDLTVYGEGSNTTLSVRHANGLESTWNLWQGNATLTAPYRWVLQTPTTSFVLDAEGLAVNAAQSTFLGGVTVNGALNASHLQASGTATVEGTLTTQTATVEGTLTATTASVTGTLTANTAAVTGVLTVGGETHLADALYVEGVALTPAWYANHTDGVHYGTLNNTGHLHAQTAEFDGLVTLEDVVGHTATWSVNVSSPLLVAQLAQLGGLTVGESANFSDVVQMLSTLTVQGPVDVTTYVIAPLLTATSIISAPVMTASTKIAAPFAQLGGSALSHPLSVVGQSYFDGDLSVPTGFVGIGATQSADLERLGVAHSASDEDVALLSATNSSFGKTVLTLKSAVDTTGANFLWAGYASTARMRIRGDGAIQTKSRVTIGTLNEFSAGLGYDVSGFPEELTQLYFTGQQTLYGQDAHKMMMLDSGVTYANTTSPLTKLHGIELGPWNGADAGATITEVNILLIDPVLYLHAGHIDDHMAMKIQPGIAAGGGTIDRAYSLYIRQPSFGTTKYALYVEGGTTYLGGDVVMGSLKLPDGTTAERTVLIYSGVTLLVGYVDSDLQGWAGGREFLTVDTNRTAHAADTHTWWNGNRSTTLLELDATELRHPHTSPALVLHDTDSTDDMTSRVLYRNDGDATRAWVGFNGDDDLSVHNAHTSGSVLLATAATTAVEVDSSQQTRFYGTVGLNHAPDALSMLYAQVATTTQHAATLMSPASFTGRLVNFDTAATSAASSWWLLYGDAFRVNGQGDVSTNGHLYVGSAATTADTPLHIQLDTSTGEAGWGRVTGNALSTASALDYMGLNVDFTYTTSNYDINQTTALHIRPTYETTTTRDIAFASAAIFAVDVDLFSTGWIDDMRVMWIRSGVLKGGTGVVTSETMLYIEAPNLGATTRYAIYVEGGPSRLGGALHVTGETNIYNALITTGRITSHADLVVDYDARVATGFKLGTTASAASYLLDIDISATTTPQWGSVTGTYNHEDPVAAIYGCRIQPTITFTRSFIGSTNVVGVEISNDIGAITSATISHAYNLYLHPPFSSNANSITNAYALFVGDGGTSGTISNGYGVYIEEPAFGSSTKYSLYVASGTTYLADRVGVGVAPNTAGGMVYAKQATDNPVATFFQEYASTTSNSVWIRANRAASTSFSHIMAESGGSTNVFEVFGDGSIVSASTVKATGLGLGVTPSYMMHVDVSSMNSPYWQFVTGSFTQTALSQTTYGRRSSPVLRYDNPAGNAVFVGDEFATQIGAVSGSTISAAFTMYVNPLYAQNSGTIQNAYGLFVAAGSTAGTVNTAYGLYVHEPTAGSTKQTLHIRSGTSYFGGRIQTGGLSTLTTTADFSAVLMAHRITYSAATISTIRLFQIDAAVTASAGGKATYVYGADIQLRMNGPGEVADTYGLMVRGGTSSPAINHTGTAFGLYVYEPNYGTTRRVIWLNSGWGKLGDNMAIGTNPNDHALMVMGDHVSTAPMKIYSSHASFVGQAVFYITANAASSSGFNLVQFQTDNGADTQFRVGGDGVAYADLGWSNSQADLSEFMEHAADGVIPYGTTVVVEEGVGIRPSNASVDQPEDVIGVTRPMEACAFIGNNPESWPSRYEIGPFGERLMANYTIYRYNFTNATGEECIGTWYEGYYAPECSPDVEVLKNSAGVETSIEPRNKANPNFDPTRTYTPRKERPEEWSVVGFVGQIPVRDGELVNPRWRRLKQSSEGVSMWMVH